MSMFVFIQIILLAFLAMAVVNLIIQGIISLCFRSLDSKVQDLLDKDDLTNNLFRNKSL